MPSLKLTLLFYCNSCLLLLAVHLRSFSITCLFLTTMLGFVADTTKDAAHGSDSPLAAERVRTFIWW